MRYALLRPARPVLALASAGRLPGAFLYCAFEQLQLAHVMAMTIQLHLVVLQRKQSATCHDFNSRAPHAGSG
jgi:hypothetical protein